MDDWDTLARESAEWLSARGAPRPDLMCVAGSGLGGIAGGLKEAVSIPYSTIPHMPACGVAGHGESLVVGRAGGRVLAVLLGRRHLYEGGSVEEATFGVRMLAAAGAAAAVLTCAAGSLRGDWKTGEIMLVEDMLDWQFLSPWARAGRRRMEGPQYFDAGLCAVLREGARQAGVLLREGVYASVPGPNYETRSEIGLLRRAGADAVGMSLAWEAAALSELEIPTAGLALLTNVCTETPRGEPLGHEEVLEAGRTGGAALTRVLVESVGKM